MANEMVNHPRHYCSHPAGIECIDVIRHYVCDVANALKYLWRAGLKAELGKDDAEKEIEDLKKALWYIEDYLKQKHDTVEEISSRFHERIKELTGHSVNEEIIVGYEDNVRLAMSSVMTAGIVYKGQIYSSYGWQGLLRAAIQYIQQRILAIEKQLVKHEIDETLDVLHGVVRPIKPACQRDTEPEKYDPQNLIIIQGEVYCLTDEVRKSITGCVANPCKLCHLSNECLSEDGTTPAKNLCDLLAAETNEYYRQVGRADYRPQDGSIVVVDEHKELEAEMREMEEEEKDE